MVDLKTLSANLPKTKKVYLTDSYTKEIDAEVLFASCERSKRCYIVLKETIFHPQGGGQPSDTGTVTGGTFDFQVKKVLEESGVVFHYGTLTSGNIAGISGKAHLKLDWERRYRIMKSHTAGHILDYAVSRFLKANVETVSAYHSHETSYVMYKLPSSISLDLAEIEKIANEVVKSCVPVKVLNIKRDEIQGRLRGAPNFERLPVLDEYRIVEIVGINSIPCSGTHVSNTCEIGSIKITGTSSDESGIAIYYDVA